MIRLEAAMPTSRFVRFIGVPERSYRRWQQRQRQGRDLSDLGPEPYLFQELVPKRYDLRVTVIGDDVFAVRIESQQSVAFAAVLAGVVVAFVASGMRALGTSSRTLPWSYPAFEDIFGRAESDVAAAQAARAASLLKTAGLNFRIVELKAGYLNAAVWWFRIALALLLALAILFVTYAARSPEEPSAREGQGQRLRGGVAESAPAVAIATHPKRLMIRPAWPTPHCASGCQCEGSVRCGR